MKVSLRGVSKRFERERVLRNIDIEFPAGGIVAVVGINGAGKSTLLHCLAGLLSLDRGEILFDGETFRRSRLDLRKKFLFLPDFPQFVLASNLLEHLSLLFSLYDRPADERTDVVIELLREFDFLGLAERPLMTLSRGQLYKAALIGLIALDPDLWLLDEPLASGMDPLGIHALQKRARLAAQNGRTIVYTTQMLEVAERFSDHVAVLHDGLIRAFTPTSQLRATGADGALVELFAKLVAEEA